MNVFSFISQVGCDQPAHQAKRKIQSGEKTRVNRGEKLAKRKQVKAFHKMIVDMLGIEGIPARHVERQEDMLLARVD